MQQTANSPQEINALDLEKHFQPYREKIIGIDASFESPYGTQDLIYADWIASGRLYGPIEDRLRNQFGPMLGNTHTESSETGIYMTNAYHLAQHIIKAHVNAGPDDVIICSGAGMTAALAKFQRILGVRIPDRLNKYLDLPDEDRPVVFITHMEHHSNHTPWLEALVDLVVLPPNEEMLVCPKALRKALNKYQDRKVKIGSFTACSNVTGIETPYHELARIMHEHGGYCFVDFAASAPYVKMDMHPHQSGGHLDAIFFSPHKFLGGPGSSGVLIFNKQLYKNRIPDHPGGGTVTWTNPWGEHHYFDDIEIREDGGTPGFLQTIRTALSIKVKENMGLEAIRQREEYLVAKAFKKLRTIPRLHILADNVEERLGIFSFYAENIHHNLFVRILNDRFGIQVRGGCSCAGTYGHFLLHVNKDTSKKITDAIDHGDLSMKPGWVRLSLHPTMTDAELDLIIDAIGQVVENIKDWQQDYIHMKKSNEYQHKNADANIMEELSEWFEMESL